MRTLIKIAWRSLFRQRRRTVITVSAMALSLAIAIPTYGLMEGLGAQMLKGVTRMELGHVQVHDPAYPRGRALYSALRRPAQLLREVRDLAGVVAATPRAHGNALASHDVEVPLRLDDSGSADSVVRFGRPIDPRAPWREDQALACEGVIDIDRARIHGVTVGAVLTPAAARRGDLCERIRVVGLRARAKIRRSSGRGILTIGLFADDLRRAFGVPTLETRGIVRHSAVLALEGVDPVNEPRVTFMAEKLIEGHYLGARARGEIVVGYRLAKVMRLKPGSKLFVQAASLDQSSGTFYREFVVAGIYRTGVEMLDRTRVFLHLADAQQLMALEGRIHEIAIVGRDARATATLAETVRRRLKTMRLKVRRGVGGRRGGSQPLPAPLTVYEAIADRGAGLIIPYDLKRRFDDLSGLAAVGRRVYVRTAVARPPQDGEAAAAEGARSLPADATTRSLRVVGVEPAIERELSGLDGRVGDGRYLDDDGTLADRWPALISEHASVELDAPVGRTLLLRTRDGDENVGWQPVQIVGLLAADRWESELPELVLPYFLAQQIDAPRLNARAHELLLLPKQGVSHDRLRDAAAAALLPIVRTWQQIAPDMAKLLQTQDAWMGVMLLVIFAIAAMTVMNTMLMAVFERTREFGVLKSVGMRPGQVFALIALETLALALVSVVVGGGIGYGLNTYLMQHGLDLRAYTGGFTYQGTFVDPIWRSVVTIKNVFLPVIMVVLVCFVVSFYPAMRAGRLKPVEALRYRG